MLIFVLGVAVGFMLCIIFEGLAEDSKPETKCDNCAVLEEMLEREAWAQASAEALARLDTDKEGH